MKSNLIKGITASVLATFSLIACQKDSNKSFKDSDIQSAQDNSLAESNYSEATLFVDMAATLNGNFSLRQATDGVNAREEGIFGACTSVTIDTVASPHVITIDFGTTNCLCLDTRKRRGKIIATYTGRYRDAGMVVNISFDNYFVNDNQIKGTHKVTNLGINNDGHLVYKVEVDGQIVKADNGGTITWKSTREREWVAGSNTPLNVVDDVYNITGSANGTIATGEAYTINITKPLVWKMTCFWFESGSVEVTPEGRLTRTLDYGSGDCDPNATVTISGITFPVVLP